MPLETGKFIHAYHLQDDFSIPDSLIERVEELASGENMPLLQNVSPKFEWAPGITIDDKHVTNEELLGAKIENNENESPIL